MLPDSMLSPLLCLAASLLTRSAAAAIIPDLFFDKKLPSLEQRSYCNNPCGYSSQLCCPSDMTCWTDTNTQASCSYGPATAQPTEAAGTWSYYTTTYLQTDEVVVTITSSVFCSGQNVVTTTMSCSESMQETQCGNQCCKAGQWCGSDGNCYDNGNGGSSGYYSSNVVTITSYASSNTATAPARVTGAVTVTSTGSAVSTVPYETPASTATIVAGAQTTSHGLSGGAIAGIVIGVIAGIILLLLICLCCCAKELIDGFLGLFGLGRRRRVRETEVIEERRSHRDSRGNQRTWFGTGGGRSARSRVSVDEKRRNSSGFGGLLGVAGLLGGLAVILGLKRRSDRRDDKMSVSSDYYSYDSYSATSPSSASSDRRSRRNRSRSRSRAYSASRSRR